MFCSQCGSENPDTNAFCVKCGASLGAGVSAPQQPPIQPAAAAVVAPPQINSHMLGAILSTLFCCLPFGIISICYAAQVSGLVASGDYAKAAKKASVAKTWMWVAILCGLLSGLLYLPAIFLPALTSAREAANRARCVNNLKQIGTSLKTYAMDYDENLPPDMTLLRTKEYLTDHLVYECPTAEAGGYVYLGSGLKDADGDGDIPIAMDKPSNHKNGVNILYLDGHVMHHTLSYPMTSCVKALKQLHPELLQSKAGLVVLKNAAEADASLK